MKILVTGGAGYIGSHTCVELLSAGHEIVVVDNFINSSPVALERVMQIAGRSFRYARADVRNKEELHKIFEGQAFDGVIHFAALKSISDSLARPLEYYDNNVSGSTALFDVMSEHGVKNLVFSSSAVVYEPTDQSPIAETFPVGNVKVPYASTKLFAEQILTDICRADASWSVIILRYFNPVGAHPSGLIGEDPNGEPSNLVPYISQVAAGRRPVLRIYGNDYPTEDGTGVRDFIHVADLASGHVAAINRLKSLSGLRILNLGTGSGTSVLQMLRAYEIATGKHIPFQFAPRRAGDLACCYADPSLAKAVLGWEAKYGLDQICADAWRWQRTNPAGYNRQD